MEENTKPKECEKGGECEPVRNGAYTFAQDPQNPKISRKTQMKCVKCEKEWYEYF
jgi:hypothetical protein